MLPTRLQNPFIGTQTSGRNKPTLKHPTICPPKKKVQSASSYNYISGRAHKVLGGGVSTHSVFLLSSRGWGSEPKE